MSHTLTNNQHNDIVVYVIPSLVDIGTAWKVLPPGLHDATLEEVRLRYATNLRRKVLFKGLSQAVRSLKSAGCQVIYLDGSYVTEKSIPGDFDICWNPIGVDTSELDPVFLKFDDKRASQKKKYGGEFFPSIAKADGSRTFIDYFQTDKDTGLAKGIIRIHLSK
jgi:hypothetical protein